MYSFNIKNAVFELIHWTNNDRIVNDSGDKGIHGTSMKDLLAVCSDGEKRLRMRIHDLTIAPHCLYTSHHPA